MIGVGRLLLATLFLLALAVDPAQPARWAVSTYALLAAYVAFAAITVAMTWSNWWLDARVAGPAHAIDIIFFTLLVIATEGYSSPDFAFFMFVLLSSAIRWGWRATALTATLLVLLYLIAVALGTTRSAAAVETQRFLVRTGHLVILSLILIWFGASRWRAHLHSGESDGPDLPSLDESPIKTNLQAAMANITARVGVFAWRDPGRAQFEAISIRDGQPSRVGVAGRSLEPALASTCFLYDLYENRAIRRDSERNLVTFAVTNVITPQVASQLALSEGLAIPVQAGGEGLMFLESVAGLSTDHLDLGEQLATDVAAHLQAHALLRATEERAEARSRLMLARDLHDGVVQFLAGAAFRLEAMLRSQAAGRDLSADLDELKQLMLQEQRDLRTFITALRSGPLVKLNDLIRDLKALAGRLSRQWNVDCDFSAQPAELMIPARLHLDVHQLVRESVANAVRHAEAKSIKVTLAAEIGTLRLEVLNDGVASRLPGGRLQTPISLKERVEQSGGSLDFSRGMGVTKLSISVPIAATHI